MTNDLKQQLDAELSRLIREYDDRGLSSEEIEDSLQWHSELASARSQSNETVALQSDD